MAQRVYTDQFNNVSIAAVQDMFDIQPGATIGVEIHEWVVGQVTATSVGNLRISNHRLPATVTTGSGGTAATPQKKNFNDAAAIHTCRVNDTTQATTSGTNSNLRGDIYNVINGYQYMPPPEDREQITISQAFIVSLDQAPGAGEVSSGTATVAELM
jgi:hypothetical protein